MAQDGSPRLGFSTGSLHTLPLQVCFRLADELGFDGMEITCDLRDETRDADRLRRLAATHAVPIVSLHAPFPVWTVPRWPREPACVVERTVHLAERIGACPGGTGGCSAQKGALSFCFAP